MTDNRAMRAALLHLAKRSPTMFYRICVASALPGFHAAVVERDGHQFLELHGDFERDGSTAQMSGKTAKETARSRRMPASLST